MRVTKPLKAVRMPSRLRRRLRWLIRRRPEPTTFQKALAVHMALASRRSELE